jgi:hypothetical protein
MLPEVIQKKMRKLTVGIACVIIGIMMMAYTGYDMLANDKIVNAGSIEITKERATLFNGRLSLAWGFLWEVSWYLSVLKGT